MLEKCVVRRGLQARSNRSTGVTKTMAPPIRSSTSPPIFFRSRGRVVLDEPDDLLDSVILRTNQKRRVAGL